MKTYQVSTLSDSSRQTRAAWLALAAVLFLALFIPLPLWAWEGRCVGVSDGDTVNVLKGGQEVKIRLAYIDCPERGQPTNRFTPVIVPRS